MTSLDQAAGSVRPEWSLFRGAAAVGALGFAIDASVLTLLVNGAGLGHYVARLVSFTAAVSCTWYCNRRWVFRSGADARREYTAFVTIQSLGALVNWIVYIGVIQAVPELARVPVIPLAAGAALAFVCNYAALRLLVFREAAGPTTESRGYTGVDNLESMQHAKNYNAHLLGFIEAHTGGPVVVDYGAGAGTFAEPVARHGRDVICVEPDATLRQTLLTLGLRAYTDLASVPIARVDSVYSCNVLEHIEDDQAALEEIYARLKPGGKLLVYVPAFGVLFTAMDRKVGHFRRYRNAPLQRQLRAAGFEIELGRYVDSLGFLVTLAYKAIGSRTGAVSAASVEIYDRFIFPVSRLLDGLCSGLFGKNLLVVARKP